ncbi:MAG: choice-of-anchor D domain-containing protein, partial [Bacteroidetes bacterium]|nr:choice-of-anchor D domain-containing protein [Bacteroidota bacterium]
MKAHTRFAIILSLLAFAIPAQAQLTFDIVSTDGSGYPEIGVTFEAKDGTGRSILDYKPSDFTVVENGIVRPVKSIVCPPPITPPVSLTFAVDVSFSMSIDGRLQKLKDASTQLVNDLSYPPAASAIVGFDDDTRILLPYTSNKATILSTIAGLTHTSGSTDLSGAFLDANTGAIDVTKNRSGDKYIVFVTDAFENITSALENQIIIAARAANIRVYTVVISPLTTNMSLRRIAQQTGGKWFENVATSEDAKGIFREIGNDIFEYPPCTLYYDTDGCDTDRALTVTLRKIGRTETRTSRVSIDPDDIVWLRVNTLLLDFGVVAGTKTENLVIRCTGGSYEVTSITSPDAAFRILDYGGSAPPFTFTPGQSRTLRIQYRPVNTERVVARLNIVSTAPCQQNVSLSGGVYDPAPMRLITPNGGEKMFSGSQFRWTWEGISGTQAAELEYSTNSGSTWTSISDNVYNFAYNWRVPNTPSDECLGFALTREERIASVDEVWSGLQPGAVREIAVAGSGTLTAAALDNGQVKIFYPKDAAFVSLLQAHSGSVNTVDFSPDMKRLASGGADGRVRIWNTGDGTMVRELTGHSGAVHTVRFTPDGNYLAVGSAGNVILWQAWDWGRAWTHNGDTSSDGALAVHPKGAWIASASGNAISILDFNGGNQLRQLTGHGNRVRSLDVTNDGLLLVSGSDDRSIRVWNALTWSQVRAMTGHTGGVNSVRASNAGGRIISASDDNSVRVWDGRDGSQLHRFDGHNAAVHTAAFDRRTKLVLSGDGDGSVRVWGYVPPLADKSDSLWTIVTTVIDLQGDPPQFDDLRCPDTWSDGEAVFVNTGNQDVTVSDARITGADANAFSFLGGFAIPPDILMRPEDTLTVPMRFFPNRVGDFSAVLELETSLPGSPVVTLPLAGHKDTVRTVSVPDTLDAGELYTCTLPASLRMILSNEGGVNVVIDSVDSDLGDAVSFPAVFPHTLLPGQSDTVEVLVHPTAFGLFEGYVRMETTPCGFTEDVLIRGNLVPTALIAEPNPVRFDFAAVGDTSWARVVVRNPLETPIVLDSLAFLVSTPPFAVLDSAAWQDSLALPDTLLPGDSIVFRLAYFPQSEGDAQGALFFHSNLPCEDSLLVMLEASSRRKPFITTSATVFTDLLCPDEPVSTATATLRNTGGLPLEVSALTLGGAHPGEFRIVSPSTPLTIDPGKEEIIQLEFQPLPAGFGTRRQMLLIIESNAENLSRIEIPFNAQKDSAFFTISPDAHGFGEMYICEFPITVRYTLRNHGTVDMDIDTDTTLAGAGFRFIDSWPITLPAGETREVAVELYPPATGNFTLNFTTDGSLCGTSASASVSYSMAPHTADISPLSLDFGTLGFGASDTRSVNVRNPQNSPMRVRIISPVNPNLTLITPASIDTVLQPGEDMDIVLRFDAATAGGMSDLLRIFTTQVCDDSVTIPITGRVDAATAALTLASLEGEIGSRVVIPIRLTNATNLSITGTHSFTADIVFNRSMLWPEGITSSTGIATFTTTPEGGDLRVHVTVEQSASPEPGVMAELTCLVMLGNSETTPLRFENFAWTEGVATTTFSGGDFTAHGICQEGGPRLIALPSIMKLYQNVPNPFNPATTLTYFLPSDADIDLRVYDALGREVARLVQGSRSAGIHSVVFDGSGLGSGSYFAVLRSGE